MFSCCHSRYLCGAFLPAICGAAGVLGAGLVRGGCDDGRVALTGSGPAVTVMLDAGDPDVVLVQWLVHGRGNDGPGYKTHVASRGVLPGAFGERIALCGRPVPDHAGRPGAARLDGELCGLCGVRLLLPLLPVTAVGDWVRGLSAPRGFVSPPDGTMGT